MRFDSLQETLTRAGFSVHTFPHRPGGPGLAGRPVVRQNHRPGGQHDPGGLGPVRGPCPRATPSTGTGAPQGRPPWPRPPRPRSTSQRQRRGGDGGADQHRRHRQPDLRPPPAPMRWCATWWGGTRWPPPLTRPCGGPERGRPLNARRLHRKTPCAQGGGPALLRLQEPGADLQRAVRPLAAFGQGRGNHGPPGGRGPGLLMPAPEQGFSRLRCFSLCGPSLPLGPPVWYTGENTQGGRYPMEIRTATPADLAAVTALEAACFPPEAAGGGQLPGPPGRLPPTPFWLLVEGDRVLAMVNGMVTQQPDLTDAMYDDASLHDPCGPWQMIFGVATHPDCRCRGYATPSSATPSRRPGPGERQGWCSPARKSWSPTTPGSALSARALGLPSTAGRPGTKCACGCDPRPLPAALC